ncbi:hypothetical protein APHAL10511_003274 [Amanita phalloides]|nr:hypothetical protein APHAL10511_003274 [Amanita phalloides]
MQGESLFNLVVRDGVIYFAVIFVANLVTVLTFIFAPMDVKAINASFSTLITNLMVSRLILNLRSVVQAGYEQDQSFELHEVLPYESASNTVEARRIFALKHIREKR